MNPTDRPNKAAIKAVLGLRTDRELARLLGVSPAAVCCWRDAPVPLTQWMRIRYEIAPHAFQASAAPAAHAA